MAMTKALGATLKTGVTQSGIGGLHEQTGKRSTNGEFLEIKSRDGSPLSVYVKNVYETRDFEAVVEASTPNKNFGDKVTIAGTVMLIQSWDVTESNDDVKKVSFSARSFPGLSA